MTDYGTLRRWMYSRKAEVDPSVNEKTYLEEVALRNAEAVRAAREKAAAARLAAKSQSWAVLRIWEGWT